MSKSRIQSIKPTIGKLDMRRGASVATERIRGRTLQRIRRRIMERDEYTCQVCGRVTAELEIDHVVPLHLGGVESDANRVALCSSCHREKSIKEEKVRGIGYLLTRG